MFINLETQLQSQTINLGVNQYLQYRFQQLSIQTNLLYIIKKSMQQQLLQGTVNITPQTMTSILQQLLTYISSPDLSDATLSNIAKALFYGLWNFDKMINQHNLSTAISQLPLSLPKQVRKNGLRFYQRLYSYLYEKWAYIDKHRINKFMQLVRYLMRESFNFCKLMKIKRSKADQMLVKKIFHDLESRSGMIYHVTDLYFQIITNFCVQQNEPFDFKNLQIFQTLLKNHKVQHFRHHIISQIYGKYKAFLLDSYQQNESQLEVQLQKVIDYFLELAKLQQKDLNRKNIYLLVGYMKSPQLDFNVYEKEKQQKALQQKIKIKKKLTKHKVKQIKDLKVKRKQRTKKLGKNKKIISKQKFQINNGKGYKKYIQDY